jgi:hypothetical protein
VLDTAVRSVLDHPAWQVEGSALAAGFNMELVPPGTLPLAAQSHQDPKWLWAAGLAGSR